MGLFQRQTPVDRLCAVEPHEKRFVARARGERFTHASGVHGVNVAVLAAEKLPGNGEELENPVAVLCVGDTVKPHLAARAEFLRRDLPTNGRKRHA